jgi:hypothetical protein
MKVPQLVVWTAGGGLLAIILVSVGVGIATYIGSRPSASLGSGQAPASGAPSSSTPNRGGGGSTANVAVATRAVPAPTLAPSDLLDQPGVIIGTLQTVNTNGILTYLPIDVEGNARAIGIVASNNTDIRLNGVPANIGALKSGMDICFLAADAEQPLQKLEAFTLLPDGKRHVKKGPIDNVSSRAIAFLAGPSAIPAAVQTTPETVVTIDGQPAKPSDLRPKMMASVEFVDITAKTITVSSTINDGKPHKVEGTIVRSNDSELVIHTTGKEGFDVKMQADSFVKVHREVPADISGPHGGVGLGTYGTQAEYSDVEVTGPSGTLLRCDFSQGMKGWKSVNGTWTTENGNLAQTSGSDNCRIITNFPDWTDYTYHLRARKNGGREGFLVLFHVRDDKNYLWWNLGGWKNVRTAFESVTNGTQTVLGENSDVTIDEGRWYDIRLEIKGRNIRAFLDNKLIADVNDNLSPRIVKLVDASIADLKTGIPATATYTGDLVSEVVLKLPDDTGGAPTMVAPSKPDAALP